MRASQPTCLDQPTEPSKLTPNNFCDSTTNSINTSLQKPLTMGPRSSTSLAREIQGRPDESGS